MNLPNKLTVLRIALVPVLALVWIFPYAQFGIVLPTYHIGHVTLPLLNLIALGIFAFASSKPNIPPPAPEPIISTILSLRL